MKFHKLVGFKITPLLKKTNTMPMPKKIYPKLPVSLGKKTNVNIPAIVAKTEPVAGKLR
ncbi:hypothetical protein [Nostoc sp.]|uniref:hypothetical protein n=1 Tax=Nostoc sp. TaxID=1180 RepID=UPI003FA59B84